MTLSCKQLVTVGTFLKSHREFPQNNMNGLLDLGKTSFKTKVKWTLTWLFYFFILLVVWMNNCDRLSFLDSVPKFHTHS